MRLGSTALQVDCGPAAAQPALPSRTSFGRLVGASTEMRRLYPLCERLAASTVPVVIEGETGTGKEVLAEALHEEGPRATGPFVVFDCTAVPADAARVGALRSRAGRVHRRDRARARASSSRPHGGTLLIDEIGDLDLPLQPKLLRALERSEVRSASAATVASSVDVRVLAATRRDLDREVQAGRFRDDLFYRLAVARIELPPLRRPRGRRARARAALLARRSAARPRRSRRPPRAVGGRSAGRATCASCATPWRAARARRARAEHARSPRRRAPARRR